ncbi:rRNA (cytosine-C(5))-methyltransferase nop2c [Turnera subulata]|uniref:rRNA (Cytosine-C(5))-methyltransferase nop2c n=1 Tax=Turnera subulata TaxID=218843 RepID=A0A9Q0FZE4_9ROSI|nr:rRNA (cytosine-C(5))-methyltransferase nop2c [Turnera subulata]
MQRLLRESLKTTPTLHRCCLSSSTTTITTSAAAAVDTSTTNRIPQMEEEDHQPGSGEERYSYNPELRWNPEVEDYFIKAYGPSHFSRISKALTYPSRYSCIRVNTLKSMPDTVMEKLRGIISQPEGGGGSISKCDIPALDYVLFVKGSGPHSINYHHSPGLPPKEVIVSRKCAEAVLRGAQVFVPGVMACSAHVEKGDKVAVSVAIEQRITDGGWAINMTRGTVLQGLQSGKKDISFLPHLIDTPTCAFVLFYSYCLEESNERFSIHIALLMSLSQRESDPYYLERNGLYIGEGTTTMSRAGMFRVLQGVAVDMNNRVFQLPSFHDVLEGEIFLQNLPSIITAHALDPQRGERILDMCAAPGGKTTAVAILMKDDGEVIAVDRSHNKVLDIQKLATEMGLTCITTYKLDALKSVKQKDDSTDLNAPGSYNSLNSQEEKVSFPMAVSNEKENERTYVSKADARKTMRRMRNGPGRNQCVGGRVENSRGFYPDSFDRVLLDAPCSALGLRPRLFAGEETIESLRRHARYQRRMFDQAVKLVRPGGVLVYSTLVCMNCLSLFFLCTINPGENEALVRYALDTYKFLSLAQQHPRIGGPGLVGCCKFPDGYVEEWLRPGEEEFVQRFDPSSPVDTIGFFIAKFSVGAKDA